MGYRLKHREGVACGLRRIAHEQISKAIGELEDRDLATELVIHQVRKRCKKLRGLFRLVRPAMGKAYREENARYRDAAGILSGLRDARSMMLAFDGLLDHFKGEIRLDSFIPLRTMCVGNGEQPSVDESELAGRLQDFATRIREGRDCLASLSLSETGFEAIAEGFQMTYVRGRDAMEAAYDSPSPEAFHEWRKRVKYHGYHLRLLQPLWGSVLKQHRGTVDRLSEYLGDDHDLAVLRDAILPCGSAGVCHQQRPEPTTMEALVALLDRRRMELQATAKPLGERIYAEKPSALVNRFRRYWQAWR